MERDADAVLPRAGAADQVAVVEPNPPRPGSHSKRRAAERLAGGGVELGAVARAQRETVIPAPLHSATDVAVVGGGDVDVERQAQAARRVLVGEAEPEVRGKAVDGPVVTHFPEHVLRGGAQAEAAGPHLQSGVERDPRALDPAQVLARVLHADARGRDRSKRARDAQAYRHARGVEGARRIVRGIAPLERPLVLEEPGDRSREAGEAQAAAEGPPLLRVLVAEGGVREHRLGAAEAAESRRIPVEGREPAFEAEACSAHGEHARARADGEEVRRRRPREIDARAGGSGSERRERGAGNHEHARASHGTRTTITLECAPSATSRAR